MENTTRIADLPDIQQNSGSSSSSQNHSFSQPNGNSYIPINIHPNPYGNQSNTPTNGIITTPLQPPSSQQYYDGFPPQSQMSSPQSQGQMYPPSTQQQQQQQYQRLPSRDIRIEQTDYTNDDEIRANYIPKMQNISTYLNEYEDDGDGGDETANKMAKHKKQKKRVRFADDLFVQLQTPVILAVLYYIFQMETVNAVLKKVTEKFVKLYNEDGSIGLYGNIAKSLLFGAAFFAVTKAEAYFG
jgi:hypothetical protein